MSSVKEDIPLLEECLRKQITKHPFIKNPNHYYIRYITLVKYLKRKGFSVHDPDFESALLSVLSNFDGLVRIRPDQYAYSPPKIRKQK